MMAPPAYSWSGFYIGAQVGWARANDDGSIVMVETNQPQHDGQARLLAAKTAMGAARMLVTSAELPEELRRKVTSPGGTTQAAITTMEAMQFPAIVQKAMQACADRSRELGL